MINQITSLVWNQQIKIYFKVPKVFKPQNKRPKSLGTSASYSSIYHGREGTLDCKLQWNPMFYERTGCLPFTSKIRDLFDVLIGLYKLF